MSIKIDMENPRIWLDSREICLKSTFTKVPKENFSHSYTVELDVEDKEQPINLS